MAVGRGGRFRAGSGVLASDRTDVELVSCDTGEHITGGDGPCRRL